MQDAACTLSHSSVQQNQAAPEFSQVTVTRSLLQRGLWETKKVEEKTQASRNLQTSEGQRGKGHVGWAPAAAMKPSFPT